MATVFPQFLVSNSRIASSPWEIQLWGLSSETFLLNYFYYNVHCKHDKQTSDYTLFRKGNIRKKVEDRGDIKKLELHAH